MLYSHDGKYPKPLPFRIVLSDGRTRTDPESFTAEEIADAGYTAVETPPEVTEGQVLTWNGATWHVRDKTVEEVQAEVNAYNLLQENSRATAYKVESDPIFFKWQRGEATQQEWLDKIAEIKARYPDRPSTNITPE